MSEQHEAVTQACRAVPVAEEMINGRWIVHFSEVATVAINKGAMSAPKATMELLESGILTLVQTL